MFVCGYLWLCMYGYVCIWLRVLTGLQSLVVATTRIELAERETNHTKATYANEWQTNGHTQQTTNKANNNQAYLLARLNISTAEVPTFPSAYRRFLVVSTTNPVGILCVVLANIEGIYAYAPEIIAKVSLMIPDC